MSRAKPGDKGLQQQHVQQQQQQQLSLQLLSSVLDAPQKTLSRAAVETLRELQSELVKVCEDARERIRSTSSDLSRLAVLYDAKYAKRKAAPEVNSGSPGKRGKVAKVTKSNSQTTKTKVNSKSSIAKLKAKPDGKRSRLSSTSKSANSTSSTAAVSSSIEDLEPPDVTEPTAHPLWATVQEYMDGNVTQEGLAYLKHLIKKMGVPRNLREIPKIGRHYSQKWAEEDRIASGKDSGDSTAVRPSKEQYGNRFGSLSQRFASALLENKETREHKYVASEVPQPPMDQVMSAQMAAEFEERLHKQLRELGLLEDDHLQGYNCEIGMKLREILIELNTKAVDLKIRCQSVLDNYSSCSAVKHVEDAQLLQLEKEIENLYWKRMTFQRRQQKPPRPLLDQIQQALRTRAEYLRIKGLYSTATNEAALAAATASVASPKRSPPKSGGRSRARKDQATKKPRQAKPRERKPKKTDGEKKPRKRAAGNNTVVLHPPIIDEPLPADILGDDTAALLAALEGDDLTQPHHLPPAPPQNEFHLQQLQQQQKQQTDALFSFIDDALEVSALGL